MRRDQLRSRNTGGVVQERRRTVSATGDSARTLADSVMAIVPQSPLTRRLLSFSAPNHREMYHPQRAIRPSLYEFGGSAKGADVLSWRTADGRPELRPHQSWSRRSVPCTRHYAREHSGFNPRHAVLGAELRALGVQQVEEVGEPFPVARVRARSANRALCRACSISRSRLGLRFSIAQSARSRSSMARGAASARSRARRGLLTARPARPGRSPPCRRDRPLPPARG